MLGIGSWALVFGLGSLTLIVASCHGTQQPLINKDQKPKAQDHVLNTLLGHPSYRK